MINPTEKKRSNYLTHFEEGAEDAILYQKRNEDKKSSAYYRRGYEFGIRIYLQQYILGYTFPPLLKKVVSND
jgi:hypothetical protein